MIMKQVDKIVRKIVDILGSDPEIQRLLFYAQDDKSKDNPTLQQLIKNNYITDYPVTLDESERFSFINVYHDNTLLSDDNVYVSTYRVSCGVSLDAWHTDTGESRLALLCDRIEELLRNQRIYNSTGELTLEAINSVYWTSFVVGNSLIFQLLEHGDINETVV